jgi:hypothetical protein
MWDGGDNISVFSVKNIYSVIANTEWPNNLTGWRIDFWKWRFPLKIKIFTCLTLKKKSPPGIFFRKLVGMVQTYAISAAGAKRQLTIFSYTAIHSTCLGQSITRQQYKNKLDWKFYIRLLGTLDYL